MSHAAPVQRLALAYGLGVALGLVGAPLWMAPLLVVVALTVPISTSKRPGRGALAVVVAVGWATPVGHDATEACAVAEDGVRGRVHGYFLAAPRTGSAPFRRLDGCDDVTVVVSDDASDGIAAGRLVVVEGRWRMGAFRPWLRARRIVDASEAGGIPGRGSTSDAGVPPGGGASLAAGPAPVHRTARVHRALVAWRDGLVGRLHRLYGERAPLVAALVFARREGMDRAVRDAFAVTGIAHLLAISGFHVGVIAGLALTLLRGMGASRRGSALGAAAVSWLYVGFIGFPDAACRAAAILGFVALSRIRGRPSARWGALAAAGLVLLVADPSRLASAGFQLSFAGAAGLVAWARPLERRMQRGVGRRLPRSVRSSLAAGAAATLATVPVVAWHFERISLVGVPMTLLASPLVSLALPGALASLGLDLVSPPAAHFLAGGVDLLLQLLVVGTEEVARWPGISLWITRLTVVAAVAGVATAVWTARRPRIGAQTRRRLTVVYLAAGVVAWPLGLGLEGRGTLELLMLDVGQGDAMALRTPRGRWLLVDAGPPAEVAAAGHPAVRGLKDRGVRRLEALVLTHPHADHYGGADAVLESFRVEGVVDPLLPAPELAYAHLLALARESGIPWRAARSGEVWEVDGVRVAVLHPSASDVAAGEANEASVVLLVSWRGFRALLTGDAYTDVERRIMEAVGDIDVLKVGHHGSETSTDPGFLETVAPEWALISVGRGNRYGHPAPAVLRRLQASGAEIFRTDRHGTVRLVVGRDGGVDVRTER